MGARYKNTPVGRGLRSNTEVLKHVNIQECPTFIYLFLFIHSTTSTHNSGFSVEVKYENEKNYYCEESEKDKEGWFTMGRSRTASAAAA